MHLQSLKIKSFRNLQDIEIHFDEKFTSHAIIGQNGSGKSNLFEAIITIFRDLDLQNSASLDYEMKYLIRGHNITITATLGKPPEISIDGEKKSAGFLRDHDKEYLPSHIFAYYSGKNERIEKLFQAHQKSFVKELRAGKDDLIRRLFYCRGGHSQLVLLACLVYSDPTFTQILKDLNILELDSALFVIKQPNYLRKELNEKDILEGDPRFWYARGTAVSEFLDKLWQLAVAPIDDKLEKQIDFRGRSEEQKQVYLYIKDKEDLQKLAELVGPPETFFRYAEGAYIGDLIEEVRISVKHKNSDGTMTFDYLSEGELQLLTVLGLMRLTSQDHCLFLLDEPDTHLNPIWKLRYFEEIEKVLQKNVDQTIKGDSQILITTHDPIMIGSLKKEQVKILRKDEGKTIISEPDQDPQGMGISGLLKSELFGLRSTVDPETQRKIDERNYLFSLGDSRSLEENNKFNKLKKELELLGYSNDFKDPIYSLFVKHMARETQFNKESLTPEEMEKRDEVAERIIKLILKGEDSNATH